MPFAGPGLGLLSFAIAADAAAIGRATSDAATDGTADAPAAGAPVGACAGTDAAAIFACRARVASRLNMLRPAWEGVEVADAPAGLDSAAAGDGPLGGAVDGGADAACADASRDEAALMPGGADAH